MAKTCQYNNCERGTYSEFCMMHKPRKAIATYKRPSSLGKHYELWQTARANWFTSNPEPYHCHYCHKLLARKAVTLDHKIPRSRRPDLRYNFANLVPCCWTCNGLKGSVAHDDYEHRCDSPTQPSDSPVS